jgi:hypothetical protein
MFALPDRTQGGQNQSIPRQVGPEAETKFDGKPRGHCGDAAKSFYLSRV